MRTRQPREQTGRRRREILDGALRCFTRQGFDATTIEQIRHSSGASHGSIYHHFGSKEAIALALYEEGMREYQQRMLTALKKQTTIEGGIRAVITCHMHWIAEDRDRALYLTRTGMTETTGTTALRIAAINRDFFHSLYEWFRPFVERGEMIKAPEDLYVSLILGASTHFARHWLAGREKVDLPKAVEVFTAAACKALCC